jgi:hypothetical protein
VPQRDEKTETEANGAEITAVEESDNDEAARTLENRATAGTGEDDTATSTEDEKENSDAEERENDKPLNRPSRTIRHPR